MYNHASLISEKPVEISALHMKTEIKGESLQNPFETSLKI